MKSIKIVMACKSGPLVQNPVAVVLNVSEADIDRIAQVITLATDHGLSEARFTKPDAQYYGGDFSATTPEIVVSDEQVWISALFHEFDAEVPINTPAITFQELNIAFNQSQSGDIWLPGTGDDVLLESVLENAEDWELSKNPIGYQVSNPDTGEHWDDRPSYEVIPYAIALGELVEARKESPGWELWTILPDTIEEPTLALM